MAYDPATQTFDLVSELSFQRGTSGVSVGVNGFSLINDGNGGTYMWDDTSTAVNDGFKIIQVSGVATGRWIRSKNSNYNTGTIQFGGILGNTNYTFNHGLNYTPVKIFLMARTANAASGSCFISTTGITTTQFTVTFLSVPILGSTNIIFDWLAVKQS